MTFEIINPLTGYPENWGGREAPSTASVWNLPDHYTITDDPEMRKFWADWKNPAMFEPEKYTLGEHEIISALGMDPRRTLDYEDAFQMGTQALNMLFDDNTGVWTDVDYMTDDWDYLLDPEHLALRTTECYEVDEGDYVDVIDHD